MRSDGKKNSCFRLVFIEFFSRFDHTLKFLLDLSVVFEDSTGLF